MYYHRIAAIIVLATTIIFSPAPIASADNSLGPSSASAAGLGPVTNSNTGSSSADSSGLQPAGQNPLQSSASAATGLSAPTANALQAPATNSDQLQVLQGEADGAPHQLTSAISWAWLWWLLGLVVVGSGSWFYLRRPFAESQFETDEPLPDTPVDQPKVEPLEPEPETTEDTPAEDA